MKSQPIVQGTLKGPMAIPRRGWWVVLGSVLVAVPVIYLAGSSGPAAARYSANVPVEPASQSVAAYLRVHASLPDHSAVSPAEQSVADYLRAHAAAAGTQTQSVPDAATQGVSDYLKAHTGVPAQNPADQGVSDILPALRQ